jgi:hypothetical protein
MRPVLLALLLTLGSLAANGQSNPPDCQFTTTFTSTGYAPDFNNRTSAGATPCVKWRVAYFADGLSALSIQLEGANDANGTAGIYAAIPSANVYEGSNPMTNAAQGTAAMTAYYPWITLHVTTFTSAGGAPHQIVARVYGYKGTSASAGSTGGFTNPMNALGDMIYGGAAGAATRLPGNTATLRKVLTQTGDGTNSAAPIWAPFGTASTTVTLGPIIDGGCVETPAFNLAGVLAGDTVFAGTTSVSMPAAVTVAAKVVSNNVVAVDVCNLSGGPYTVSSATFTVAMSR